MSLPNFEIVQRRRRRFERDPGRPGHRSVDHFISGLPVPSFPRDLQRSLFQAVGRVLRPEGTFNQITEIPWLYQRLYQRQFEDVRFVLEPRNIPPAGTYFCRRPRSLE